MHQVETQTPSRDFLECFCAAGVHLEQMAKLEGLQIRWFKAEPTPPFLEHLSFSLGNQVFFVRLKDVTGNLEVPGSTEGLIAISKGCQGHACILPMHRANDKWKAFGTGWCLRDAKSGKRISPIDAITYEDIELTDWELQDFAIQIVKQHLTNLGHKVISSNNNPEVLPSMWYEDDEGPKWLIVLASRYPQKIGTCASYWKDCVKSLREKGYQGMVVNVGFKGDKECDNGRWPIYRDHAAQVIFKGLIDVEKELIGPSLSSDPHEIAKPTKKVHKLLSLLQSPVMPAPWSSSTPGKTLVWGDYFALFQTNTETTGDITRKFQGQAPRRELLHDFALVVFYRRDKNPHGLTARPILIFTLERFDFDALGPGVPKLGTGVEQYPTLSLYHADGRVNYGIIHSPLNEQYALELFLTKMKNYLHLEGEPQIIGTIDDARGHPLTGWPAREKKGFFSKIKKFFS